MFKRSKYKKTGQDYILYKTGYEGGISPTGNGKWHWWLRHGTRRFSTETDTLKMAKASIDLMIWKIEEGTVDPSFYIQNM